MALMAFMVCVYVVSLPSAAQPPAPQVPGSWVAGFLGYTTAEHPSLHQPNNVFSDFRESSFLRRGDAAATGDEGSTRPRPRQRSNTGDKTMQIVCSTYNGSRNERMTGPLSCGDSLAQFCSQPAVVRSCLLRPKIAAGARSPRGLLRCSGTLPCCACLRASSCLPLRALPLTDVGAFCCMSSILDTTRHTAHQQAWVRCGLLLQGALFKSFQIPAHYHLYYPALSMPLHLYIPNGASPCYSTTK